MTLNQSIRELIKSWVEQGFDAPHICSLLKSKASKATVYRWIDRIQKNSMIAKTSPGRPRTVRTKKFIAKVKRNLVINTKRKSARKIACDENCSPRTVGRIIKEDLNLKAYKKIKVPALTVNHIKQRKDFSIWIRNNFTHDSCQKILFFDEKWFNEDGQFNRQNDRVYAESRQAANEDIGTHAVHKYPFKVMVWYGI